MKRGVEVNERHDVHVPVMRERIVELLAPALTEPGATYVDATLGLGGHAAAILEACPQAHLVGIDRDPQALAVARERLAAFQGRTTFVEAVYDELPQVLSDIGRPRVAAVLMDLGLSSLQIDRRERGFAYSVDAPLDMRMDGRQTLSAAVVVNTYDVRALAGILRRYGEERFADRIATRIVQARAEAPFDRSARLVQVVSDAIPMAARKSGGHPAKRTFQALRIEVNAELVVLERALPAAIAALQVGGRLAVLSYHSLEDRLTKQALRTASTERAPRDLPVVPQGYGPELALLTRGAERPTQTEVTANPRAASARLRAAERIEEAA